VKYLLDTNIIVALTENADENVVMRAALCDVGDMVTSSIALAEVALSIALAEVAFGTERGDPPTMELLRAFVEEVPVLDFDYKAALAYAQLPFKRASFDRLIAAHAVSQDLIVVTGNAKDFADVPGLKVENWTV
jgi:tRNA(fMet)-specific endonuclease VapC